MTKESWIYTWIGVILAGITGLIFTLTRKNYISRDLEV